MEAVALLKVASLQIGKWMVEEAKYLYAVKDKVEELQRELEWIQCFLRNADEKKGDDELVRKWISEINDFSYEAEDIVEKYLLKVSNPRKEGGIWSLLKWAACVLCDGNATREVGTEIDALTSKISKLSTRMKTYGLMPASSPSYSSINEMRCIHPLIPVDDVVGLNEDTNTLVNQLMNREPKVIVISGMAGSGKTTLARKVYLAVKGRQFKMCAWVSVSQEKQPRDVFENILLSLYADDQTERKDIKNATELHEKLYKVLEDKKCLVVLDDLWKSRYWDCLKNAFPIHSSSSKLLITTRNSALLSDVHHQRFPYQPSGLSPDHSWELFCKKAFLGTDTRDSEMEQLGREMVDRCKNLPLAIVVLAGLLAPKKTTEEWRSVHNTFLRGNNHSVTKVLELSYMDLPYHLKPCFLHLGNFPEDSEISTKKLYRMWIAEGIVSPGNDSRSVNLEEIGKSYLWELVQRCMVQVGKRGLSGKIKTCRLHDLMWKMCTSKAKEEKFLSVVSHEGMDVGNGNHSALGDEKLHRIAIHLGQSRFPCRFNKASNVRSLVFFGTAPVGNAKLKQMINDFKLLRVLDLENTGIEEVPKVLGNLIHLRYLSFLGTQVKELPSSIGNLMCLQTLDLRVCLKPGCVMGIPNVLWRMKELKYLYLPSHPYKVKRFQKLKLKGLSNLKILKNFDTTRSRVNDLLELGNLKKFFIKNEVSDVEALKIILECQSIKSSKIVNLSLKIHGAILNKDAEILSTCSCLHTLEMSGTSSDKTELMLESFKFPRYLNNLFIKNCKLNSKDPMQTFKKLQNLRSLSLDGVSFSGDCMDCTHGGFSKLVDLKLSNMDTLKMWKVGGTAMRNLYRVQLYNCDKDLMIPEGLPKSVRVICRPCLPGIHNYLTCPTSTVEFVDDDDDDLATQLLGKLSPLVATRFSGTNF